MEALIENFRTTFKAKGKLQLISGDIVFPLLTVYVIFSNKRRGVYFIFHASHAAPNREWCIFEDGVYLKVACDKELF